MKCKNTTKIITTKSPYLWKRVAQWQGTHDPSKFGLSSPLSPDCVKFSQKNFDCRSLNMPVT